MERDGLARSPAAPVLGAPSPESARQMALWSEAGVAPMPACEIASAETVHELVAALAQQVVADLGGKPLTLAAVLRRAFVFAADLAWDPIAK